MLMRLYEMWSSFLQRLQVEQLPDDTWLVAIRRGEAMYATCVMADSQPSALIAAGVPSCMHMMYTAKTEKARATWRWEAERWVYGVTTDTQTDYNGWMKQPIWFNQLPREFVEMLADEPRVAHDFALDHGMTEWAEFIAQRPEYTGMGLLWEHWAL